MSKEPYTVLSYKMLVPPDITNHVLRIATHSELIMLGELIDAVLKNDKKAIDKAMELIIVPDDNPPLIEFERVLKSE